MFALHYHSLPCCSMMTGPHSVLIVLFSDVAGRLMSKFSATAFRFIGRWEIRLMISLRVGSAIAWKTSLLASIGNHLVTNVKGTNDLYNFFGRNLKIVSKLKQCIIPFYR